MPFDLINSPATFQCLMDRFRSGLSDVCEVAYLDDLFVVSDDVVFHVRDLRKVFDRLRVLGLKANRDKCMFTRDRVTYLGHVISSQGIQTDPEKVAAIVNMRSPSNLKELRSFLQTCSWFRKFIPQFSEIARPLTCLTKKNGKWTWGEEQIQAFATLKDKLTSAPILRQPDFKVPFVIRTDASAYALGAVLMQGEEAKDERLIEYASRLLTATECNYAVVWALDKFRGFVESSQIRIATVHQPLRWLMSLKTPSGRLARWAMEIQAYNLNIEYTPGKINLIADTLSRPPHSSSTENAACDLCSVSIDLPHRDAAEIHAAQLEDPYVQNILKDFESEDMKFTRWTDRGYYVAQGVLYRVDPDGETEEPQLVVPRSLRGELMKERSPIDVISDIRSILDNSNFVPQITPYLKRFTESLQEIKWRQERQQDLRKEVADYGMREAQLYQAGDFVLITLNPGKSFFVVFIFLLKM
ncbi:unnamed protein product [Parnassius mnemosyne]|uniref:RNA-directed DNA polymerase n=1 Tax=Parnassius mnemosyne TaxID=213953 RepID=A0AAV1LU44_9NEOP